MSEKIKVRIAPSPTGNLHIGTARTALFNYLFAKKNKGSFVLRIEDTDQERSKKNFEEDIFKGLSWLGINYDEGPLKEKDCCLYRQSERKKIYSSYIKKLIEEDSAYHCFCSEKDLEIQRQYQMGRGEFPKYNKKCSTLTRKESEQLIKDGNKSVIRIRAPHQKIKFKDLIRGDIEFDSETVGDIIIAKNTETPLYNLAVVIDDYEMKITHVIRGEDHISNTPKQIVLSEALKIKSPIYAHLPLILAPDKTKLSKRFGAVSITEYKNQGYLPEALINFMAFLGWNPGTEKEIYSLDELISDFSIEKIQLSGAIFNVTKLDSINSYYIKNKPIEELTELCLPYLIDSGLIEKNNNKFFLTEEKKEIEKKYIESAISLYKERIKKLSEIPELVDFLFKSTEYDKSILLWKNMSEEKLIESIDIIIKTLSNINETDWTKDFIQETLMPEAEKTGDRGSVLWPMRACLSGKKASAGPFEIAELIGKKETLKRLKNAVNI